jgi:replicative DNA helicase
MQVTANLNDFNIVEAGVNLKDFFRRNIIMPISEVDDFRKRYNNTGVYITAYRSNSENIRESEVYADLYFDFDKEDDFEAVRQDALVAMAYLRSNFGIPYEVPRIYFSGCKGIHITVDAEVLGILPSKNLNDVYKLIASDIKMALPNQTLDIKIYDKVRLFRLVNSIHQKTGLYKVQITFEELKSAAYEVILDIAKHVRSDLDKPKTSRIDFATTVIQTYIDKVASDSDKRTYRDGRIITIESCPPCIDNLLKNGISAGSRNNVALMLSSYYKQRGFEYQDALESMLTWNSNVLQRPMPEKEMERCVKQVYDNDYSYGCQALREYSICDPDNCELSRRDQMGATSTTPVLRLVTKDEVIQESKTLFDGRECYDFEQEMLSIIDNVEQYNWSRGSLGGLSFGDDMFNEAFNGLQPALYILAGQPNIGKSMLALHLAWQVVQCNPKSYVIYFAIDDPDVAILPRLIALDQRIPINVAKIPEKFADNEVYMQKRNLGLQSLKRSVDRFKLLDNRFGYTVEHIIRVAQAHKAKFEAMGLDKQVVVFVDNLYDLKTEERVSDPNQVLQTCSEKLDRFCESQLVPVFCTGELKKLNGTRRPILDDLKDSIELQYEASAVMLCYNEVQIKAERAEVYHQWAGKEGKQPVLEVHVAKNKLGEYHGRLFYNMFPGYSYLVPVNSEGAKYYTSKMQN